jgi:hypothetical protein
MSEDTKCGHSDLEVDTDGEGIVQIHCHQCGATGSLTADMIFSLGGDSEDDEEDGEDSSDQEETRA